MSQWLQLSGLAVSVALSVIAILIAWRALSQSRRQTALMETQLREQKAQEREDSEWAERFDRLANQLTHINPLMQVAPQGKTVVLYTAVFNEPNLQRALERYVIQRDASTTQFQARRPLPHELRNANLRETVQKAEQAIVDFQRNNKWGVDLKYYLGG